ncbi:haloacid dehalogenase-like hydrolase [Actinomadura rubteroloni]|uniref:Haloacid dehalogenase-like hydrolase n=1 Tax=Actinomadura rubteroloni TaxID=1926885 RepID=A0A2P4UET7_9ACTN|nr:haloacid dehalogenase-like hydrolase [Actinomadura rubteroloni]POM23584.1 haloacid dehalogenase-like hydrolase [Actinomadura rubteroloni]
MAAVRPSIGSEAIVVPAPVEVVDDRESPERVAVLDMDGTLVPRTLGLDLLAELVARGHCDVAVARRVFELARRGGGTDDRLNAAMYGHYHHAVVTTAPERLAAAAERTWSRASASVFPFVADLWALLRRHGHRILIISGSPQEVVAVAARALNADGWRGADLGRHDDRALLTALPGGKTKAFSALTAARAVDLSASFALGNSRFDAEIFALVGRPLAFEPDAKLFELADRNNWSTATRDTVLARSQELLGGRGEVRSERR